MSDKKIGLAELKNLAMGFDRAQMRDVHVVEGKQDHLSKRHMGVWNVDKNELACIAPKSYMVIQHRYAVECLIEALSSLNIKADAQLKQSRHGIQIDFDFPESKLELTEVGESFTTGIRVFSDYSQVAGLVIAARVTMLPLQAVEDPLGRVALLGRRLPVLLEHLIDDGNERTQNRTLNRLLARVFGRATRLQNPLHCRSVDVHLAGDTPH